MRFIKVNRCGVYCELVLARPDKANALNTEMLQALLAALDCIAGYSEQVVLLRAEGATFCAGLDLYEVVRFTQEGDEKAIAHLNYLVGCCLAKLATLEKWLVVSVNGNVCGGGVGFLAVADCVIAHTSTNLMFSELGMGLTPAQLYPYVLARFGAKVDKWFTQVATFSAQTDAMQAIITQCSDDVVHAVSMYLQSLSADKLSAFIAFKQVTLAYSVKVDEGWSKRAADSFAKQATLSVAAGLLQRFE